MKMTKAMDEAYKYMMNEGEISLFACLEHLAQIGITPSPAEVDYLAMMVDDILTELDLVRSFKAGWNMKKINRLCYGI